LKLLQSEIVYYNSSVPVHFFNKEVFSIEQAEHITYCNRLYTFLFISCLVKPPEIYALG
jgi:hypothetical protein